MHNKNNNKTHTYIQGLRPFSSSIPKTLKKHLRKGGYNYSNIVDNWTKMVSKEISDNCYPLTVKMGKEMKDGTLVLNVIHGKEMDVEYKKNEIIEIKLSNRKNKTNLKTPNYLLFVEHNHVYTLGRSGNKHHLLFSEDILIRSIHLSRQRCDRRQKSQDCLRCQIDFPHYKMR